MSSTSPLCFLGLLFLVNANVYNSEYVLGAQITGKTSCDYSDSKLGLYSRVNCLGDPVLGDFTSGKHTLSIVLGQKRFVLNDDIITKQSVSNDLLQGHVNEADDILHFSIPIISVPSSGLGSTTSPWNCMPNGGAECELIGDGSSTLEITIRKPTWEYLIEEIPAAILPFDSVAFQYELRDQVNVSYPGGVRQQFWDAFYAQVLFAALGNRERVTEGIKTLGEDWMSFFGSNISSIINDIEGPYQSFMYSHGQRRAPISCNCGYGDNATDGDDFSSWFFEVIPLAPSCSIHRFVSTRARARAQIDISLSMSRGGAKSVNDPTKLQFAEFNITFEQQDGIHTRDTRIFEDAVQKTDSSVLVHAILHSLEVENAWTNGWSLPSEIDGGIVICNFPPLSSSSEDITILPDNRNYPHNLVKKAFVELLNEKEGIVGDGLDPSNIFSVSPSPKLFENSTEGNQTGFWFYVSSAVITSILTRPHGKTAGNDLVRLTTNQNIYAATTPKEFSHDPLIADPACCDMFNSSDQFFNFVSQEFRRNSIMPRKIYDVIEQHMLFNTTRGKNSFGFWGKKNTTLTELEEEDVRQIWNDARLRVALTSKSAKQTPPTYFLKGPLSLSLPRPFSDINNILSHNPLKLTIHIGRKLIELSNNMFPRNGEEESLYRMRHNNEAGTKETIFDKYGSSPSSRYVPTLTPNQVVTAIDEETAEIVGKYPELLTPTKNTHETAKGYDKVPSDSLGKTKCTIFSFAEVFELEEYICNDSRESPIESIALISLLTCSINKVLSPTEYSMESSTVSNNIFNTWQMADTFGLVSFGTQKPRIEPGTCQKLRHRFPLLFVNNHRIGDSVFSKIDLAQTLAKYLAANRDTSGNMLSAEMATNTQCVNNYYYIIPVIPGIFLPQRFPGSASTMIDYSDLMQALNISETNGFDPVSLKTNLDKGMTIRHIPTFSNRVRKLGGHKYSPLVIQRIGTSLPFSCMDQIFPSDGPNNITDVKQNNLEKGIWNVSEPDRPGVPQCTHANNMSGIMCLLLGQHTESDGISKYVFFIVLGGCGVVLFVCTFFLAIRYESKHPRSSYAYKT